MPRTGDDEASYLDQFIADSASGSAASYWVNKTVHSESWVDETVHSERDVNDLSVNEEFVDCSSIAALAENAGDIFISVDDDVQSTDNSTKQS